MFRFADPHFFWLLLLLPALMFYRRRRVHPPRMGFSTLAGAIRVPSSPALVIARGLTLLKYIALALMIAALARPQWGTRQMKMPTEGINIILAVDLSESMAALDFKQGDAAINRLEAVKKVVREFVENRTGDRIGMVVFGSEAYTQLPLTRDYGAIFTILDRLKIGAAGKATAIGDAVGISLKRLEDVPSRSNVVILLTDGQSNAGEITPSAATEVAAQQGVKVYTIGVGGKAEAPFLVKHPVFGDRYVYRRVPLDEDTLTEIARQTGGLYFRAENLEGLQKIYATIDTMEKTRIEGTTFAAYREYYPFLLLPAFGLLGLWIFLANTRFLRVP